METAPELGFYPRLRLIMSCFAFSSSRDARLCGLACVALLLTTGCSDFKWPTPLRAYRMDIQQGNVVTPEMVSKLKPGMTRAQVRFALGTPLVVDAFRTDRWDYVYYFEKPDEPRVYRHVVVYFKGDRLEHLEGDSFPSRGEKKAPAAPEKKPVGTNDKAVAPAAGAATAGATGGEAQKKEASGAAQATAKEDKPAGNTSGQGGGYSEPIKDSLGF